MKTRQFFTSVTVFAFATFLMPAVFVSTSYAATGINIISQTHHVWGSIDWIPSGSVLDSYDITDSAPVSGFVSFPEALGNSQSSSTGDFTVDTQSGSSDTPNPSYAGWGGAQIDYTFQPQTDSLQIAFSGNSGIYYFTGHSAFVLTDLDTSVILDSRTWEYHYIDGWQDDILPYYGSYAVIPDHTYSMTLSAHSSQPDIWYGSAHLEAVVTPEPATLLLFGLGVAIIPGLRKKR